VRLLNYTPDAETSGLRFKRSTTFKVVSTRNREVNTVYLLVSYYAGSNPYYFLGPVGYRCQSFGNVCPSSNITGDVTGYVKVRAIPDWTIYQFNVSEQSIELVFEGSNSTGTFRFYMPQQTVPVYLCRGDDRGFTPLFGADKAKHPSCVWDLVHIVHE